VGRATVATGGLSGDRQDDLRFHGGPERAVSLFSLERIRALQDEGHPIAPGTIGENLTLSGLDWNAVHPGVRLAAGSARLLVTAYVVPCQKIAGSFAAGEYRRVSQKLHPGWSRLYARVLHEGEVQVGDTVDLLPE
jgi:MOSC domain-containing protein YiiM